MTRFSQQVKEDKIKMEPLNFSNLSLELVAGKVNELVEVANQYHEERIEGLKKQMNLIRYGKYMTDEEVIDDMRRQDFISGLLKKLH